MTRVLRKIIVPVYCFRDAKVLYMLCITLYVMYYKMCEITVKLPF